MELSSHSLAAKKSDSTRLPRQKPKIHQYGRHSYVQAALSRPSVIFNYFNKRTKAFPGIGGYFIFAGNTVNTLQIWLASTTYDALRSWNYFGLKSVGFWSRWILYLTPATRRPQYFPILPRQSSLPPFGPLSSMSQLGCNNEPAFGYISAVETAEYGYFGGYLIVSPLGRPLEFHCSAPVRPNRAQQILYGATLESYLLGEQIGGSLLKAAKLTPNVVFTDSEALLHSRDVISVPMVLVLRADSPGSRLTASEIQFEAFKLHLPIGYEQDATQITNSLALFTRRVDLIEPFGRIHEAIKEAQRIGSGGNDGHEQAA